jgi:GTP:adenosylcobinamide-phosphate guanylyltransferase
MNPQAVYDSVVLAGQRQGLTPLSERAGVAVDVLVPVGGRPAIERVLGALRDCAQARPRVVVGPAQVVLDANAQLREVIDEFGVTWLEPLGDPATSAIAGISGLPTPILVTTGDHALLTPRLIDDFCTAAAAAGVDKDLDIVAGLVAYDVVKKAYPESRRTVLKFADGGLCGANLFFVRTQAGRRAFEFWCDLQHDRKHPHKMAWRIGLWILAKYLCGRLTLAAAMDTLSARSGCRVGAVRLEDARAAVDVDSVEDWQLAERIVQESA